MGKYNLGRVRLKLMQSAVSPFTVCDLWGGPLEICRAFLVAFLMQCCLLIIADRLLSVSESFRILAPSPPSRLVAGRKVVSTDYSV